MKNKIFRFIGIFALLLTAVGVYAATKDLCLAGIIFAEGVAVTGTVTTESIEAEASNMGANIIRDDWSAEVAKIRPQDAPCDTMLRTIGATTTTSYTIKMASINVVSGTIEVDGIVAQNTAGTTVNIVVTAASLNECLVHRVLEYSDVTLAKKVKLYIVAKSLGTRTITCSVLNGAGTGDQIGSSGIASATILYSIGTAKYETDAQTEPYAKLPEIDENYCQIQMMQVEESEYAQVQQKEIPYGMLEFKENAMYNFRLDNEKTHLLGYKKALVDPIDTRRTIYFAGGFEYYNKTKVLYVPNATEANGGMALSLWNRIGAKIFTTNGSPERVCFYEPQFMVEMLRIAEFQKMMDAAQTELFFGVKCKRVETGFGVVNFVMDHALTKANRIGEACIMDVSKVRIKYFKKMQWDEVELSKSGQSLVNAWRLSERSCCEFFNIKTGCWIYTSTSNITNPADRIVDL